MTHRLLVPALLGLALLCTPAGARADARSDLSQAADDQVPSVARQQAFDRLVMLGATDIGVVREVAQAPDGDTRKRWVAIRVLGHVGGDGPEQVLLSLVDDPQPAIRAAVVGALGELGDWEHTSVIAARLEDPAIIVRAEAASALSQLKDPAAVDALGKALRDGSNYHRGAPLWVRRHYARALGEIGHKSGVPALLQAMDDPDPQVQAEVIPAYEKIAGFSMSQGRTEQQEREAWRRWAAAQVR